MAEPMEGVIDYMASQAAESEKERILALKNVGPLHHVCKGPPITPRPHPSQDFISLFHLSATATAVRRVDPATGEKINKLRKSYEGKVKELRIPGRNKAVSKAGEWFPHMMNVPEEDWVNTNVRGKMPESITPAPDWPAKLSKALSMQPGKLPQDRDSHYRNIINLDDTIATATTTTAKPATLRAPLPGLGVPGSLSGKPPLPHAHTSPASPAAAAKLHRPERHGAKRRYMDSSFVGYGDGFGDDDGTEDADGKRGLKKRRKESYSAATTPIGATSSGVSVTATTASTSMLAETSGAPRVH